MLFRSEAGRSTLQRPEHSPLLKMCTYLDIFFGGYYKEIPEKQLENISKTVGKSKSTVALTR